MRALWPDVAVTDNALTQVISDLRQALRDDAAAPRFIQTVARRGYRFVAAVEAIPPGGEASASPATAPLVPAPVPRAGRTGYEQPRRPPCVHRRAGGTRADGPGARARGHRAVRPRGGSRSPLRAPLRRAGARALLDLRGHPGDQPPGRGHAVCRDCGRPSRHRSRSGSGRGACGAGADAPQCRTQPRGACGGPPRRRARAGQLAQSLPAGDRGLGQRRVAAFERVLDLYPDFVYAYYGLAMVHVARGDLSGAERLLRQGVPWRIDRPGAARALSRAWPALAARPGSPRGR